MISPFFADNDVTIWQADARTLPLPDASVDLIVTSPPYYALRSYTDAGQPVAGQLGSEPTPSEFVEELIGVTREMIRVLKPAGSLWVNLGDKYATYAGNRSAGRSSLQGATDRGRPAVPRAAGLDGGGEIAAKSLMGIPWRYALRCIDDLGLILRAEVIWAKPNGLPESVTDRVRRAHEQWFHFTRSPRYFSAVDEIREPHSEGTHAGRTRTVGNISGNGIRHREFAGNTDSFNPLGKLPGSVWTIPTQPLTVPDDLGVDHFAAFPMEFPRRIIRGWSPAGVCTACGEGRRPRVDAPGTGRDNNPTAGARVNGLGLNGDDYRRHRAEHPRVIVGEMCGCPDSSAPTRPGVVLDPFGGTGTTALVARVLGRRVHHVELSGDYCRLARWRVTDPGERARAAQVPMPPTVGDGQGMLLDVV